MSVDTYYKVGQNRMDLSGYLQKYPLSDMENKFGELIDVAKDILVFTDEGYVSSRAHDAVSMEWFRYYHHDVRKMYRLWKKTARDLFATNMTLFSTEYDDFSDIDTVPFDVLKQELPDFPCTYGFDWLDKIQKEIVEKVKIVQRAQKRFNSGLAGKKIIFDGKDITIGEKRIELPAFKNEYDLATVMFSREPKTPVEWVEIAKRITGYGFDKLDKKSDKRAVKDVAYAINKRIHNELGTSDDLFTWKDDCVTRNY